MQRAVYLPTPNGACSLWYAVAYLLYLYGRCYRILKDLRRTHTMPGAYVLTAT